MEQLISKEGIYIHMEDRELLRSKASDFGLIASQYTDLQRHYMKLAEEQEKLEKEWAALKQAASVSSDTEDAKSTKPTNRSSSGNGKSTAKIKSDSLSDKTVLEAVCKKVHLTKNKKNEPAVKAYYNIPGITRRGKMSSRLVKIRSDKHKSELLTSLVGAPQHFILPNNKVHTIRNVEDIAVKHGGEFHSIFTEGFSAERPRSDTPTDRLAVSDFSQVSGATIAAPKSKILPSHIDDQALFDEHMKTVVERTKFLPVKIGNVRQSEYSKLPFSSDTIIYRNEFTPPKWAKSYDDALKMYNAKSVKGRNLITLGECVLGRHGEYVGPDLFNTALQHHGFDGDISIPVIETFNNGDGGVDFREGGETFDIKTRNGGKNWGILDSGVDINSPKREIKADYLIQIVAGNALPQSILETRGVTASFVFYVVGYISRQDYYDHLQVIKTRDGNCLACDYLRPIGELIRKMLIGRHNRISSK